MRGMGYSTGLGQTETTATITPAQAVTQAIQMAGNVNLNPSFLTNQAGLQKWYSQIQNGQFDTTWVSPSCAGIISKNPDLSLTQAAGSIAAAGTSAAAVAAGGAATAAGVALGAATLGIGVIVAVLGVIFAHHAAAVAEEQNVECTATAAANNSMNVLAEGVSTGQIAPADAATALGTLYQNYAATVKPAWGTSPYCNANCELEILMQAMVLYWQAQYNAMAAQQAASPASAIPGASAVESAISAAGLPSWTIYALGAFLLWELLS